MKMKTKIEIITFILWYYENHIQEDWDDYNKFGKICIYPAWFIKAIFMWIITPLYIPEYLFKTSKVYATFQETGMAPTPEQLKQIQKMNKRNTQNFLNSKGKR
jgi:hypothetical protein